MLLIAGGESDPNLHALAQAAADMAVPWVDMLVPAGSSPPFHWDLAQPHTDLPWDDASGLPSQPTTPKVQGAFIRHDVFAAMHDPRPEVAQRAQGWFAALHGWLLAHPQVRVFNADMAAVAYNKPAALLCAQTAGLRIPPTWVSNDTVRLRERLTQPTIAKPVGGGGLCQTLDEALAEVQADFSAMPALIQPRLVAPELRVFVVGPHSFAFEVSSPSLDYRAEQDAQVSPVAVPPEIQPLRRLMAHFRMDFGAADFKTDPHSGALVFLELNTSPMFAHFNQASQGELCRAMVSHLMAS